MSTTVSRGIDRRPECPPPMRMSRMESERLGPFVLAPGSLVFAVRWSEPSTRTVVALKGGVPWPASAFLAASSTWELWIWAETRKRTSERASHAPTATATHLRTRPALIGFFVRPGLPRSRSRKRAKVSPPRSKSRGRARYFVYRGGSSGRSGGTDMAVYGGAGDGVGLRDRGRPRRHEAPRRGRRRRAARRPPGAPGRPRGRSACPARDDRRRRARGPCRGGR